MKSSISIFLFTIMLIITILPGCTDDPEPLNEPELITTLRMTFTPAAGGNPKVLQFSDPDGTGGVAPVVSADTLSASTAYAVTIEVLNESVTPADTISLEILEEGETHQFFFITAAGLNLSFTYADTDNGGYPIGLSATAQTAVAGSGTLTVVLRHEPDKQAAGVEDGDITNAGGDTDIEVVFDVVID